MEYKKLTLDKPEKTKIMCGHVTLTVKQLEDEIDANSEIGKKLKQYESELEKY